jgi:hypothetical protein
MQSSTQAKFPTTQQILQTERERNTHLGLAISAFSLLFWFGLAAFWNIPNRIRTDDMITIRAPVESEASGNQPVAPLPVPEPGAAVALGWYSAAQAQQLSVGAHGWIEFETVQGSGSQRLNGLVYRISPPNSEGRVTVLLELVVVPGQANAVPAGRRGQMSIESSRQSLLRWLLLGDARDEAEGAGAPLP